MGLKIREAFWTKVRYEWAKGRRRGKRLPATESLEKLTLSAMNLRFLIMTCLACRSSLAFVVVAAAPPRLVGLNGSLCASRFIDVAGASGYPRDCTSGSRSSRSTSRPLRASASGSRNSGGRMSPTDLARNDGLTTSFGQTDGGGEQGCGRGEVHPEAEIFVRAAGPFSFEAAVAGSSHFGDIMGSGEGNKGEQDRGLLHHFDAMERVILTANGNLQRVISSYYNSPVTVDIVHCREVEPSVYERAVEISVFGRVFCIAKSLVVLHNPICVEAVKTGSVGIGQLFRSLDILPNFELLNAGYRAGISPALKGSAGDSGGRGGNEAKAGEAAAAVGGRGGLWRVYDLRSRHLSCRIHEEFPPDLFDLNKSKRAR